MAREPDHPQNLRRSIGCIFLRSDWYAHLFHPIDPPWQGLPPLGTGATTTSSATPPGIIHWYLKHPQCTGVQAHPGHPGGTGRKLQPHGPDKDQGCRPSLLPHQVGVLCVVLIINHNRFRKIPVGGGTDIPIPSKGMER